MQEETNVNESVEAANVEQPTESKPFKVFTTETEYKNYIAAKIEEVVSKEKAERQTAINTAVGETIDRFEKDIFEATGIPKKDKERYFHYAIRTIEEKKTNGNTDQKVLEELQKQKQTYESQLSEYKTKLSTLESENILSKKQNAINSNLPKNLKDDVLAKTYLQSVIQETLSFEHVDNDGSILLKKGDAFVKDENGNPYTLENYLNEKVKIIQVENTLKGTNAGESQTAVKPVNTLGIVVGNVENIDQLSANMREEAVKKGINPNTKEFANQIYLEAKERGFVK